MRQLRVGVIIGAGWLCSTLSCRSEPDANPSAIPSARAAEAERVADCTAAVFLVRDTFRALSKNPDPAPWERLASSFEGELARDAARVGEGLNQAVILNRSADSLIRAAGEPYNRGHVPGNVNAEAAKLRSQARQRLTELDGDVARIAERVTKLPRAACRRILDSSADGGP